VPDAVRYVELPGIGPCSQLALGTMDFSPERMDQASSILDAFLELGGNTIDTAHGYGGGRSERAIGEWLRQRGTRERVVILDKGAHPDETGPRVNPGAIAQDLLASLERLQVAQIDIYLLHRDDPRLPVGPIVEALEAHRRAGRIRVYGGSNWSCARIDEANAYARAHGLAGFACSSPNVSLAVPRIPRWPGCVSVGPEDRDWYAARQLPVFSWSSQAGGFFTDRFSPERTENAEMVRTYYTAENWARKARAEELGRQKGVSGNQVALAYVLHQPFPCCALIGPLSLEELRSSAVAQSVVLTPEDVRWLETGTR